MGIMVRRRAIVLSLSALIALGTSGCGGQSEQEQLEASGFTAVQVVSGQETGRPVYEVTANGCTFQVYRENLNNPNIGGSEGWYVVRDGAPANKVQRFLLDDFSPEALQAAGNPGGTCRGRG